MRTSPIPPAAAEASPLEEQAYRHLRQALMEGAFAPGDKLSMRRIAAQLGTSPMPVRKALTRLQAEQALDVTPAGTSFVPRLSRAAFRELGEVRAALEPLALRLAAPRCDAPALRHLQGLLEEHRTARVSGRPQDSQRADREFLFGLYRRAEAPLLLGMIEGLWLRRGPVFWEARWMLVGRPDPQAHRHAEILEALRQGDGEAAALELEHEIRAATAFLLKEMRFADDDAPSWQGRALRPAPTPRRR